MLRGVQSGEVVKNVTFDLIMIIILVAYFIF